MEKSVTFAPFLKGFSKAVEKVKKVLFSHNFLKKIIEKSRNSRKKCHIFLMSLRISENRVQNVFLQVLEFAVSSYTMAPIQSLKSTKTAATSKIQGSQLSTWKPRHKLSL